MSLRLISKNETYHQQPKEPDPNKQIELSYVTEYAVEVATPEDSLAKSYVILQKLIGLRGIFGLIYRE